MGRTEPDNPASMSSDTDTETIGAVNPILSCSTQYSRCRCQIGLKIPYWSGADGYARPGTSTRLAERPIPYGG